jgi:hypothetical protein
MRLLGCKASASTRHMPAIPIQRFLRAVEREGGTGAHEHKILSPLENRSRAIVEPWCCSISPVLWTHLCARDESQCMNEMIQ